MTQEKDHEVHRLAGVIRDYTAAYTDPLVVKEGDQLSVGERDTEYPNWIWCSNDAGKAGWVPESYLRIVTAANDADMGRIENRLATVRADYDATELSVKIGQGLTVLQEESGWVRCRTNEGLVGWVPSSHLKVVS